MSFPDKYRLSASNRMTTAGHVYYLAEQWGGGIKGRTGRWTGGLTGVFVRQSKVRYDSSTLNLLKSRRTKQELTEQLN